MNLITLEEYKAYQNIAKTDQDDKITRLIASVSSLIQKYTGLEFNNSEQIITEVIDLDYDAREIFLDKYPVNEIVSVTEINPYYYDSSVHFPVPNTLYTVDLADGRLIRAQNMYWPQGFGAVTVTYKTGATNLQPPADLKQAAIDLVTYYLKEQWIENRAMRGASISNGDLGYGYTSKFPPHIQRVLDLYT